MSPCVSREIVMYVYVLASSSLPGEVCVFLYSGIV